MADNRKIYRVALHTCAFFNHSSFKPGQANQAACALLLLVGVMTAAGILALLNGPTPKPTQYETTPTLRSGFQDMKASSFANAADMLLELASMLAVLSYITKMTAIKTRGVRNKRHALRVRFECDRAY